MKYLLKLVVVLFSCIVSIGCSSIEKSEINQDYNFVEDKDDLFDSEIDDLYEGVVAIVDPDNTFVEPEIAFLKPEVAFISSAMGGNFPVFSSQYAEDWEKILPPQAVEVLDEDDNWLEVYIDGDIWWVDTDFVPSLDEVEEAFLSLGDDISFYFHNIETGFRHGFNSDQAYVGASVGKVFYTNFLYIQDEIESISLTGQERLWIQKVLRTSLDEFSNNLNAHYGVVKYNSWLEKQGIHALQASDRHYGLKTRLKVEEVASLMYGIYHYFQTKTPNAVEFRENMTNNQVPFIVSDSYKVASKTGWLPTHEIRHDVAIVEAPSPYILVILSQNSKVNQDHLYHFKLLSALFEDFNNKWFVAGKLD